MPRSATASRSRKKPAFADFPWGGTPAWEIAYLFPAQGTWTEGDFWDIERLHDRSPRIELSNGRLDVLPIPTMLHQLVLGEFLGLLYDHVHAHAPGVVVGSGFKVRLGKGIYRDPDIVYMKAKRARRQRENYWNGADLIAEVVSPEPEAKERDWKTKRREYARASIPEYWIIDPQKEVVRVLTLKGKSYRVHGDFKPGETATSKLLPGFEVSVDETLAPPGSEKAR